MSKPTAKVTHARIYGDFVGPGYIVGIVHGHPNLRDGGMIRSSQIVRRIFDAVETENTIYECEWAPDSLSCHEHMALLHRIDAESIQSTERFQRA